MDVLSAVKKQYELYPYPRFSWLAKPTLYGALHATFETGAALTFGRRESHEGKKIGLFGCGTNEALVFGLNHPRAHVVACDVSEKTIRLSKLRCKIYGAGAEHHAQDLVEFAKAHRSEFDYIHCFGVLHHLSDFRQGLKGLSESLKPEGFARIMVYSEVSRRRITHLQKYFKEMKIHFSDPDCFRRAQKLIKGLDPNHPHRLTFESHPESKNKKGFVDAFLHAHELSFSLKTLMNHLNEAGLQIQAWDFSQNVLRRLEGTQGLTLQDKITSLETAEQWPSPFTFWVTKIGTRPEYLGQLIINPAFDFKRRIPRHFYSVILRKELRFSNSQKNFLSDLKTRPFSVTEVLRLKITADDLDELQRARIVLKIAHK